MECCLLFPVQSAASGTFAVKELLTGKRPDQGNFAAVNYRSKTGPDSTVRMVDGSVRNCPRRRKVVPQQA